MQLGGGGGGEALQQTYHYIRRLFNNCPRWTEPPAGLNHHYLNGNGTHVLPQADAPHVYVRALPLCCFRHLVSN